MPKPTLHLFAILCALLSFAQAPQAQVVTATSQVSLDGYKGKAKSSIEQQALEDAKSRLIINALTKLERPEAVTLLRGCSISRGLIDQSILSYRSKNKVQNTTYTLRASAKVDISLVEQALKTCGTTHANAMGFVVVARQQISSSKEGEDEFLSYSGDVESGLESVFKESNFQIVSTLEMEMRSDGLYKKVRLVNEFERTGKVNWQAAADAGFISGMEYLTMGSVEISEVTINPVNKLYKASAVANFNVADLASRDLVASAHGIQADAIAKDKRTATIEAIKKVTGLASVKLIDQLRIHSSSNH